MEKCLDIQYQKKEIREECRIDASPLFQLHKDYDMQPQVAHKLSNGIEKCYSHVLIAKHEHVAAYVND